MQIIAKKYSKCGKIFLDEEIDLIINTVSQLYYTNRCKISRVICEKLNWYSENGKPKEWICREFLIELEKENLIKLPPPVPKSFNRLKKKNFENIVFNEPQKVFEGNLSIFAKPTFKLVATPSENTFWEYLVGKYHYLGYKGVIGRFVKYIVYLDDIPIACIGYSGASLKVSVRDRYINWDDTTRINNIKHIANNFRFVIFPWVKIKYLASHILSRNVSLLVNDWKKQYNVDIYLLETFVEKNRFAGTCYKASNWTYLGTTAGYAKTKQSYTHHGIIKDVYVYPVSSNSINLLKCN